LRENCDEDEGLQGLYFPRLQTTLKTIASTFSQQTIAASLSRMKSWGGLTRIELRRDIASRRKTNSAFLFQLRKWEIGTIRGWIAQRDAR